LLVPRQTNSRDSTVSAGGIVAALEREACSCMPPGYAEVPFGHLTMRLCPGAKNAPGTILAKSREDETQIASAR